MRKAEFIEWVAWEAELPQYAANRFLRAFAKGIQGALRSGHRVTLWGLGTFEARPCRAKRVEDLDGNGKMVPARHKVSFKPARSLKHAARKGR